MTPAHSSAILVAFVTALGVAAACSSDSGSTGPPGPRGDCILPTTSNFVDSAQGRVVIVNNSYIPATIQVRTGMTVRWVYCEAAGSNAHTVTSDASGLWDSGSLSSGTFSRVFAAAGSFPYHCIPHPEMTAVVTVVD